MGKINIIKKKGHFVYFYYSRSFNFYTLVPNFVQFLHFSFKNAYINLNYHKLNNKDFKFLLKLWVYMFSNFLEELGKKL